ncbi:MAG: hypothetical protein QXE31_01790 [Candidatus Woesearchaeota archaeon]
MPDNNQELTLKLTGAIGDTIIASSLVQGLNEIGYIVNIISSRQALLLLKHLSGIGELRESSKNVIDLSDYLKWLPHTTMLPKKFTGEEDRFGHLCEWMAYTLFEKSGIKILPSRDDVKIILTPEEVEQGKIKINEISKENNNLPVVVIAPYASVKNRSLPKKTLDEVIRGISGFAHPFLLPRYDNLRELCAILYACDAFIGVDSGLLHMINGVLQGTPYEIGTNNSNKNKVVVVFGSSNPEVVTYFGNHVIKTTFNCEIGFCGIHGYWNIEDYVKRFGREIIRINDKSGCIYEAYANSQIPPCMASITAEEIIESVRKIIKG